MPFKSYILFRNCFCLQSYVCNICEALLYIPAECFYCDCCGVCADAACIKKANQGLKCKEITMDNSPTIDHHWVKGIFNLKFKTMKYVKSWILIQKKTLK